MTVFLVFYCPMLFIVQADEMDILTKLVGLRKALRV